MSFKDIDRQILGREFDRTTFPAVTVEDLITYAQAIGETDPRYLDGSVAPPTYVVDLVMLRGERMIPDVVVREMSGGGFDAGKDIELGSPVRPGDVLTAAATIHDIYEKTGRSGTMVFIVVRAVITNQRDEMVAVIDQRMMQRGRE